MSVDAVKIRPMYMFVGSDAMQVQTITCVGDVADSLDGKYFVFHDSANAKHYAWFNTSGGAATDPAPGGSWTAHAVAITTGANAAAVATALAAVLTAVTGFDAAASGKVVTLTNTVAGYAMPARDALDSSDQCGFGFRITTLGFTEVNVGNLEGDIEVSGFEVTKLEIKTHATGSTVQSEIITGYGKPTLKVTLLDFDQTALRRALIMGGSHAMLPEGSGATELVGYGPTNVGGANPTLKVRLHPVDLDLADKSEDWNFWKGQFSLESLKWSGESTSSVPMSISIYPDTAKPKEIQFLAVGDVEAAGY